MYTFYLLGDGSGFLMYSFVIAGIFLVLAIGLEALAMRVMDYTPSLKKILMYSAVANGVSLLCCALLVKLFGFYPDEGTLINLLIFYLITVAIESFVLYSLNPGKPVMVTIQVSAVMNFCTYILIYFLTSLD